MKVVDPIVSVLRRYRENAGISQQEMSNITNISYRTLQRLESGESDMKLSHYRQYLKALNLADMDVSIALYNHEFTTANDVAAVSRKLPLKFRYVLIRFLNELSEILKESGN